LAGDLKVSGSDPAQNLMPSLTPDCQKISNYNSQPDSSVLLIIDFARRAMKKVVIFGIQESQSQNMALGTIYPLYQK